MLSSVLGDRESPARSPRQTRPGLEPLAAPRREGRGVCAPRSCPSDEAFQTRTKSAPEKYPRALRNAQAQEEPRNMATNGERAKATSRNSPQAPHPYGCASTLSIDPTAPPLMARLCWHAGRRSGRRAARQLVNLESTASSPSSVGWPSYFLPFMKRVGVELMPNCWVPTSRLASSLSPIILSS